jgi:hypothetical protein
MDAFLFKSVLNNREYELLDREIGRQNNAVSIGSLPMRIERDQPSLIDLCSANSNQAVFAIRSAALQLKGLEHAVNWPLFNALAQVDAEWKPQARLCEQIEDAGKVNIAVVKHPSLMLGGDGTEHLMRALGCNVVDVPLDGIVSHSVPIHGVYIPHGLLYIGLDKFFNNLYLKTMLTRGAAGNAFLLAEGGAAPIMGDRIVLPSGPVPESRGFNILPFDSFYMSLSLGAPQKSAAFSKSANPFISGSQEWVWGYSSHNLSFVSPDPDEERWDLRESADGKIIGSDAWSKGRILASKMRIEPWSAPEQFRRWLEG